MERNARTKKLKIAIIAIALLLCLALAIGITTAFYQARRAVKGVVVFDQGIKFTITEVQDDSENNKGPYQLQYYSNKVVDDTEGNKIVLDTNVLPGEVLYVAIPTVNPASDTVPFALRAKLSYIYKDAEGQALDINSLTARQALFQTLYDGNSAIDFGNNWLYDTTTDYFYYVNNESNGLKLSNIAKITGETSPFGVFNDNLSGASKLEMNQDFGDIEAGGPIVEGHEIRTVEIVLDLEFIQYVEQSIIDIWGDSSVVVDENGVLTSATGFLVDEVIVPEVVDGKTVTQVGYGDTSATINAQNLVLPQTVTKIAAFSFPETTKDMTVRFDSSSTLSSGASFRVSTLDGGTTYDLSIGAGAFAGCPNLIISLPSDKTYYVADNAFDDSAQIRFGSSSIAVKWGTVKNDTSSYNITTFTPSYGTSNSNYNSSGITSDSNVYYDTTEYISEDGLWGYNVITSEYDMTNWGVYDKYKTNGKYVVITHYLGADGGAVTAPSSLGDDLNGYYPVLVVGSECHNPFVGKKYSNGNKTYYLPVFTGNYLQINIPEGVLYVNAVVTPADTYVKYGEITGRSDYNTYKGGSASIYLPSTFKGFSWNFSQALYLTGINVSSNNEDFASVDGVLYSKDLKTLIYYPDLKPGSSFEVPSYVEQIGCEEYLGGRVARNVFGFVQNLKELTINSNVISTGFKGSLSSGTYNYFEKIVLNASDGSYDCFAKSLIIGDEFGGKVNGGASEYLYVGKNVNITDNRNRFCFSGQEDGFGYLSVKNIAQVEISPENTHVAKIGDYLYQNYSYISHDDNIVYRNDTGELLFAYNLPKGNYAVPSFIRSIAQRAFRETNLTSISFEYNIEEIPLEAFYNCTSLESVTLPSSVTKIGSSAFSGCTSLTTINLPEGIIEIPKYTFSRCTSLTSIIIPSTVTSIGDYAFQNCRNLADVKYAISYDLNGVEADPIERVFVAATLNASGGLDGKVTTEITLPAAPTNATRTFLGWFDGSEIKEAGSLCTPARRKIIAAWEGLLPKYVITLDANGGTGTYTIEVEPGSSFVFPDFTGFKNESGFPYEWRSTATYVNGTTKCYSPGASITPTTDMTFFVYYMSMSNVKASGYIQGRQGYTPEYILSKENPNYGDSIEVTFEIPSKFKISQIRYSVDNMKSYKVVERQYPVCGETVTVTIDNISYYITYFEFVVADEYAEYIFDYEREGIEPVTIGGWLNDSSYKFVAPSSRILDGQSIKGWEKRNVSYPPFIPSGSEFTPYTNDRTAGTYYAVWEDARIVSGSASTKKGKEEDLRLEEEFMRGYYDLMNKAYSGDYSREEIEAMQQEFMQSDVYIRYMGADSVSYNAYVSGLVKSGDVYITCDSALLKTEAYQVTGSDAGYAIELYEVLMRYTNAEDINTYEYLYLKCTKGVDGEGNTIFFRNETTNSCAGQYMGMQLYICLSWEVNVTINNGIDGEEPTTLQLHNGDKIPFPTLSKEGYIFGGWSLTENGSIEVSAERAQAQYVNFHGERTYYPVFYKELVIAFDLNGGAGTLPDPVTTAKSRTISIPGVGDITRENYEFQGWALVNEEETELTTYSEGNWTFNYTGENFTLKAKWHFDGIIYYSDSSKSESITSGKVTWNNGACLASGKEFSKDGRVVIGWSETPDADYPTYNLFLTGEDIYCSELYAVYANQADVVQINIDFTGIDVTSLGFNETDINYGIVYNSTMYVYEFPYGNYMWKVQEDENSDWFIFEKGMSLEKLNGYKGQTITLINNSSEGETQY